MNIAIEVVETFGVSLPTIKRYLKLRRETGDVEPKRMPGPPSRKGAALREWLPIQLKSNPDLTLREHCEAFKEECGISMSTATMSRTIRRLPGGWSLKKKTLRASERDEEERIGWCKGACRIDPALFVWVDECGTHTSMTRLYARAPRGQRAYGSAPRNRGKNTTLIASMTLNEGMGEAMCVEGSTTKEVFEAYVEHFLAPSLNEGQVVVLDNLGAHKGKKVRKLIEDRGAELLFLPAYSPDLNPVEEAFSKIKALLEKAAARTREALVEAIGEALLTVTPQDVAGWLAHCGYEVRAQGP